MQFQHFTSVYEVFIGALSAFVLFDSVQNFFLVRHGEKYQGFLTKKERSIYRLKTIESYYENVPVPSKKADKIKKKIEKINHKIMLFELRQNNLLSKKDEQLFARKLIVNTSFFIISFYVVILFASGLEQDDTIIKSVELYSIIGNLETIFISVFSFYFLHSCSKGTNKIKEQVRNINLKFSIIWFMIMLFLLSIFYIYKYEIIDYFVPTCSYVILPVSFSFVIIPIGVLLYRNMIYLSYKSNHIQKKLNKIDIQLNDLERKMIWFY